MYENSVSETVDDGDENYNYTILLIFSKEF